MDCMDESERLDQPAFGGQTSVEVVANWVAQRRNPVDTLWHDAAILGNTGQDNVPLVWHLICNLRKSVMTPGMNRLWGRAFPLPSLLPRRYTSQTHLLIPHPDEAPMFTLPRDAAEPRLRWDLVVRVRREIEAGTYETPEKWALALARLEADLEDPTHTTDEQPA
jgi:hypothetical protein